MTPITRERSIQQWLQVPGLTDEIPVAHERLNSDFEALGAWIDRDLDRLEEQLRDFVTRRSLQNSFGRRR